MAKKKTTKKTTKKAAKKTLPAVNGKSLAAGEKKLEKPETVEKIKRQVMKKSNLELIKQLKPEILGKEFSIGDLARVHKIAFQKCRYMIHQIAKHEGRSVVKLARGKWTIE